MVVFIFYIKDVDVIDLVEVMESNIFRYYGLFKSYVSDRGSLSGIMFHVCDTYELCCG